jgi:hypothetical protein
VAVEPWAQALIWAFKLPVARPELAGAGFGSGEHNRLIDRLSGGNGLRLSAGRHRIDRPRLPEAGTVRQ